MTWRDSGIGTIIGKNNSSSHLFFETSTRSLQVSEVDDRLEQLCEHCQRAGATQMLIPEPGSLMLLATAGVLSFRRRKA